MPKILKILTGPQEGAELELDAGIALRIGTDASCDVALVDAMAPSLAAELLLQDDNVMVTAQAEQIFMGEEPLVVGQSTSMTDYTILTIGSTRCAVGDSDKVWPPMKWIPLDVLLADKTAAPAETAAPKADEKATPATEAAETSKAPTATAAEEDAPLSREQLEKLDELQSKKRAARRKKLAILLWGILLLGCAVAMWVTGKYVWSKAQPKEVIQEEPVDVQKRNQDELRAKVIAYHLDMEEDEKGDIRRISGNLPTVSQRILIEQAIRYEAPYITCELTDDETLARSVKGLIWGLAEERLKLVSLHDRIAEITGMTESEEEWKTIVENIRHDVPRLAGLKSEVVYADAMAARLREALKQTGFHDVGIEILPGELQFTGFVPESDRETFIAFLAEAMHYFPDNAKLSNMVKWRSPATATEDGAAEDMRPRQLPIIGIAVHPIPYVILADGQRMGMGSVVGGYTIKDISLTEVTLSNDNEQLIWRP